MIKKEFIYHCQVKCKDTKQRNDLIIFLKDLGYLHYFNQIFDDDEIYLYTELYDNSEKISCSWRNICQDYTNDYITDCDDNIELFKALVSINNIDDYMQYFICIESHLSFGMKDYNIGDFQLYTDQNKARAHRSWRKATKEELINNFKNK
jgi:hypothetical protein